jgi:RimJ/RimL family protein N-acetyltransferase
MGLEIDAADETVRSERLSLRWMSPAFLRASLEGQRAGAEGLIGAKLPRGWPDAQVARLLEMRLGQMREDRASAPWLLRAMVREADGVMVGYINFHDAAVDGRAELGYTVLEPYRRLGYAREAALAMMDWAATTRGVRTFVVSVSPENEASLALTDALGFIRTGIQIDEVDGEEWVFELDWKAAGGGKRG